MPPLAFGLHPIARSDGDPATELFPSHRFMLEDCVRAEQGANHLLCSVAETSAFPNYWDGIELRAHEAFPRTRA